MPHSKQTIRTPRNFRAGRFALAALALIVFGLALLSCSGHRARNQQLLETDYRALPDDRLLLYYYELEDQIEIVERQGVEPRISLGFGLSTYGSGTSVGSGLGVSTSARPTGRAAHALRQRRNDVRLELQRRGLSP